MTEHEIITMLSETLGAVVIPKSLLDHDDPAVQEWRAWNRSLAPAPALSEIRTLQRERFIQRRRKRRAAA